MGLETNVYNEPHYWRQTQTSNIVCYITIYLRRPPILRQDWDGNLQTFEGYAPALALASSSEGRILAPGLSNGKIGLWDTVTGHRFQLLECDSEPIQTVAFRPEERTLVSVSRRGTIRLWDIVICVATCFVYI